MYGCGTVSVSVVGLMEVSATLILIQVCCVVMLFILAPSSSCNILNLNSWCVYVGVFSFLSYRDPNLLKTLDIYDGTVDFLRELEMDDDTLTKAIIGTIGDVDAYQLPDAKGYSRYVGGWFCSSSWNCLFSFFLWLFSSLLFPLSGQNLALILP